MRMIRPVGRIPIFVAVVLAALMAAPGCGGGPASSGSRTYANTYRDYTGRDLEALKRFDVAVVEPYSLPDRRFVRELGDSGTEVLAYLSIGEADSGRRYRREWEPIGRTPDNPGIPRTVLAGDDTAFIGPDPGWKDSYLVDASNPTWREVVLDQEIPYILWLGGGRFDGLMLDMVDVVDEYEGMPGGDRMRDGMIDLIKAVREKYPDLMLVPNRGFGILEEMAPYIDGFKFEEMNGAYGTVKGEPHYRRYHLLVDEAGKRENARELALLARVLKKHPMPVLVLDHVRTKPPDLESARRCYDLALEFGMKHSIEVMWYGNSVDQDLPIWPFLPLRGSPP
jgi:uncharacterized protein (TIGR01370 family)